jgi:protocatechuate 4,5-dioxygenase alpha chain
MHSTRERDYDDIPGTYVFDGERCLKGFALNMFCKSLDLAANREVFRRDPNVYLSSFDLTKEQRNAVVARDWLEMLRLGGNIYYTFKLAIFDGLTMQHIGAAMSANPTSVEEFRAMMVSGGRAISGNRSIKEQRNG